MSAVLDASSLLAFLNREPGSDRVEAAIHDGAVVGAVALAAVVARLAEHGIPVGQIERAVEGLGIEVAPFDRELAYVAGRLRADLRARGLSGAGSACLALGLRDGRPVLTADPTWAALDDVHGPKVEQIR